MKIIAKVPLRMSYFGGGTDVPPYCDKYGAEILYSTINRYAYCEITSVDEKEILIGEENERFDIKDNQYTDEDGLVKAVLSELKPTKGFRIKIYCDVNKGTGLGGSSSQIAAIILACCMWDGINISKKDLVKLVYHIEHDILNVKCGYQDSITTVYGGFGYLKIRSIDDFEFENIHISQNDIYTLKKSLMLINTGMHHNSSDIICDQIRQQEEDKEQRILLNSMKELANQARNVLEQRDFELFGRMLHKEWQYKKGMSKHITNGYINKLYEESLELGALGGKVLGAGGGGYLLLYVPLNLQVHFKEIFSVDEIISEWEFDYIGARVEKI